MIVCVEGGAYIVANKHSMSERENDLVLYTEEGEHASKHNKHLSTIYSNHLFHCNPFGSA